jgi:hypothetical protein
MSVGGNPWADCCSGIGIMEYKGYLIFGRAQVTNLYPGSLHWRSQGIVFTNTPQGAFMIKRLNGGVYDSKRAAEEHGLDLCIKWVDKNPNEA